MQVFLIVVATVRDCFMITSQGVLRTLVVNKTSESSDDEKQKVSKALKMQGMLPWGRRSCASHILMFTRFVCVQNHNPYMIIYYFSIKQDIIKLTKAALFLRFFP